MQPRTAKESYTETTHLVLPNDTNTLGNLFGGQVMKWLDMACAISAHRHCKRVVVTAAVNNVSFDRPIKLGDFVTIQTKVSRCFSTSMEVWADVWVEDQVTGNKIACNSAIYTFVAVDQAGHPAQVPPVIPEGEEDTSLGMYYLSYLSEACEKVNVRFESNANQFRDSDVTVINLTFVF